MTSLDSPTGARSGAVQPWRPQLHLTPSRSRMADPNGLVWHAREYHLYFRSPEDSAQVSWGHATSPDLLRWTEQPVAIRATPSESVASGSVVVDALDTAGLAHGGTPPLVAVYTATDPRTGEQHQVLAASEDGGYTWQRVPDGPLLRGAGGGDRIRDPRVFRYPPESCWVMLAAAGDQQVVEFWCSTDLISWEQVGRFGPYGPAGIRWEVPDLIEVPIDADPAGGSRWVLALSVSPRPAGGSGMVYAVGDFDGRRFVPTQDGDAFGPFSWVDHGPDFYAATSFAHDPHRTGPQGSPVWVGWLGNWAYADVVPTSPWRGVQSLPRTLRLARCPGGGDRFRLVQRPVPEIATARDGLGTRLLHVPLPAGPDGEPTVRRRVPGAGGTCLELRMDVEVGPGARAGVEVLASADGVQYTRVSWSQESGELCLDRRVSGVSGFHPEFAAPAVGPLDGEPVTEGPAAGGRRVRFAVWVDVCCVEVFGGDGETVLSAQVFPDGESTFLSMYAEGGPVVVRELQVWPLRTPPATA